MENKNLYLKERIHYMIFTLFKKNVRDFSTIYSVLVSKIGEDEISTLNKSTIRRYVKDFETINKSFFLKNNGEYGE